jgi:hypothetical protein
MSGDGAVAPDAGGGVTSGDHHHYVTSSLRLGANATEADRYAFDLDGDGEKDNKIGGLLSLLGSFLDADRRLDEAVKGGQIVLLHSVRADSLVSDETVSWRVLVGTPRPSPDLTSGAGQFTVASSSPQNAILSGKLVGGVFEGGPATVTVELALIENQPPIRVRLVATRAAARVGTAGCTEGRMGGAITAAEIDSNLIPALALGLDGIVAADDGCRESYASCDATTRSILGAFDGNGDRVITANEVRASFVAQLLFSPDVDLLDASGQPGKDGTAESVSLALGFTCTRAVFTAPGE